MDTAAILNIVLTANTTQASAAMARTQAQLGATQKKANAAGLTMGKAFVGLGVAAAAAGVALFKVGQEFDDAYDKIRTQTGATGKDMVKLKRQFRDVVSDVPADFETAAKSVGELNSRLGLTGKPLGRMAKQMTELSRITDTDLSTNVEAVSKAFVDWEVKVKDQSKTLDGFFRLSQRSGMAVADIAANIQKFGSPLRQLGFTVEEAAAMFASFERAGVNIQTMVPGLKLAISNLTRPTETLAASMADLGIKAGDPEKALTQVFDILGDKNRSQVEKTGLAMDVFGKRAGADMAEAVSQGRFELDEFLKIMRDGEGTIRKTGRQTMDLDEHFQKFSNNLKLAVEPVARDVFEGLGDLMKEVSAAFKRGGLEEAAGVIAKKLEEITPKVLEAGAQLGAKLAGALIRGFLNAPLWVQLATAAFLLRGPIKKGIAAAGAKLGEKLAAGMAGYLGATRVGTMLAGSLSIIGWGSVGAAIGVAMGLGIAAYLGTKVGPKLADVLQTSIESEDIAAAAKFKLDEGAFTQWIFAAKQAGEAVTVQMVRSWRQSGLVSNQEAKKMIAAIKTVRDNWQHGWGPVNEATERAGRQAGDNLEDGARRGGKAAQDGKDKVAHEYRSLSSIVGDQTGKIKRDTDQNLDDANQKGSGHTRDLNRAAGGHYRSLADTVRNAMENIQENTAGSLKALGVKKIPDFGFKEMAETSGGGAGAARQRGGPIELALGGLAALVPGRSTGDRHTLSIDGVPKAKVESGEGVFVGNRKMMGAAAAANAAVPRFQAGGMVDPAGPGTGVVNKAIADVVGRWSTQYNAAINYGYDPGGGHQSPGHNITGTATDTGPAGEDWYGPGGDLFERGLRAIVGQVDQILYGSHGIGTPYPNHGFGNHAHIEWGMHPEVQGAVLDQIKRQIIQGPAGPLKDIGQKAVDKVRSAANKWLSKQMGSTGGDFETMGGGVLSQDAIAGVWSQAGGARSKAHIASAIAMAESSGDPNAVSSAGARGLWQIMPFHGGGDKLFEPVFNAMKAIDISANGTDWGAWDVAGRAGQPVTYTQFLAEGGEVSIPELFPHLGSDDQDRRKNTLDRILGKIADFGIKDWWADPLYAGTKNLADYQEFAGLAALRDITDSNDNLIPGIFSRDGIDGTEHTWLTKAREEAWNLRRNLIVAHEAMPGQINQFEGKDGLIKKAEKRLKQVREALHDAQIKLGKLLDEVDRQRGIIEDAREKLALTGNQELSNSQKDRQRQRIEDAQGIIENITGNRIPGVENDIQRATRERDALVSPITEALATKYTDLKAIREAITDEGYTDDVTGKSFDSLKTIQGAGSPMNKDMAMPDNLEQIFGGTLNDIQHQLLAMIPAAKPGDTVIDQLEAALALSGLTADLSDDIAAQSQIVTYWEEELARLQSSGGSAQDIGSAANSLQSARDALAGLQETTSGSETDSLKLEALMAENARLRMSAQQAGTFAGFFKQFSAMPQFATGGVMAQTGPALVHGREGIFTPDQMAALGGRGDVNVNVNLDGMDVVVETWIDGVLAKETRKALSRGPTVGRRTN